MSPARLRAVVMLGLIVLASLAAWAWRPSARLADTRPRIELEQIFPKRFGDWALDDRVPVQLISPDLQATLDKIYNQVLSRTYVNANGDRVMLSVAYGGDQSDATRAHRPEVCYPAQGFQIMSGSSVSLDLGAQQLPVRQLVARQGGRNEPITYWITVGERVTTTGTQQKLAQLSYSTRGLIPDGMLVRVSTIDTDAARGFQVQQGFIEQLGQALPGAQRSLVIGQRGA